MNPYSKDFRKKAIELLDEGNSISGVAKLLKISRDSLRLWLKRRKETGSFEAKKIGEKAMGIKYLT